ncbi:MAG: GHKL domain-containing protein [Candidatus Omnitrophica bacterium]|nr:GHKL domain-containing protein [Candidatus Omnitrophota bacterium]
MLTIFSNEISRLNNVIESFLAAARPSTPQFTLVNLYNLITEILNLMEPEFLQNNIFVSLHEEGNWPLVRADHNQLKQAFINVLRNAIEAISTQSEDEAAHKSKEVIIHQIRSETEVTIAFEDTGKGMPPEDIPHIFEPYFTSKPKGTGLGLMVVNRIVREHEGTVSATSQEGIGTQISISLPVAAESPKLLEQGTQST